MDVTRCERCPRLRTWCELVAREKRAAYAEEVYWGLPVPNFGPDDASRLIVGLAPAAHGANRTGRMFTGDRSGEWLYRALHRAGLANQPTSLHRGDGLGLRDTLITAVCHCAPPDNKPTREEMANCSDYLRAAVLHPARRAILCLGGIAWESTLRILEVKPRAKFSHGAMVSIGDLAVLGCYHPSQQNTFTGRLTEAMLDQVIQQFAAASG
ncbi:MAG: uracil-DNA glycosylase [Chthonomonas sp.]|nr:uracil-DNA glycosylase [Chthonomonas sp.]